MVARELVRHGVPPFAEVAALTEFVGVVVADVEEGDFFFGR